MKSFFKTLTFIFLVTFITESVLAGVLVQDIQKSFLRWKIQGKKEQLTISKVGSKVIIQSLDPDFFVLLSGDISKLTKDKKYHKDFKFISPKDPASAYKVEINLSSSSVELFNFYKKDVSGYVLDFWVNQDFVTTKKSSMSVRSKKLKVAKLNSKKRKKERRKSNKVEQVFAVKNNAKFNIINPDEIISKQAGSKFRDFRYGAAFVWDYKALIPPLKEDLNLKNKAPDYFYHIEDQKYLDDKKLAHLQLNINFYNKEQWGLMTRSISLFEEQYGRGEFKDINDFMKAVSLIKTTIKEKLKPEFAKKIDESGEEVAAESFSNKGMLAAARNILTGVLDSSKNYELKKAIWRYLIQSSRNEGDYIQTLNFAKGLYVGASESFDDEMISWSSNVILNSLAHLKQMDKIKSFLNNKAVKRVLTPQIGISYVGYVNLTQGKINQVMADFKINERSLVSPIHPSILFNTAESHFRRAEYKKAIKLYDEFIDKYSFITQAAQARLRIALSYDLLGKDISKVVRLYKDAINMSSDIQTRIEAKIRYVGLRVCRNRKLNQADKEAIVFLDSSAKAKSVQTPELQKLLWLTRMRTMISTAKYDDALAYLSALPIENLRRIDQRAFHADGAEIVLGIIQSSYLKGDYSRAVKVWEIYKTKYESKVAKNPYLSFIVSDSFIKLGLLRSYKRAVKDLLTLKQSQSRRYPLWVSLHKDLTIKDYLIELKLETLLASKDFKGLSKFLSENKKNKGINYNFYKGIVSYEIKDYNSSVTSFESLFVTPNLKNILTPNQSRQMLQVYLESLYEAAKPSKFRKNTSALVNDLRRKNYVGYKTILTRAEYLYIESLYSEQKIDYKLLDLKSKEFLADFSDTEHKHRVNFLRGVALIHTKQEKQGKEILKKLIQDDKVVEYLKGLATSEMTTLELRNRKL